jgi:CRISPR-associated protein Cmr1
LVFLGGVGARSRRGGGNLTVIDYNPKDLPKDLEKISFTPTGDFCEWFVKNLKEAKHLVGSSKGSCDKYSNLSNVKLVLSKTEFNAWFEALNDIGKEFMRFRRENKQSVFDTAVFGLPVMHSNGKFVEAERGIRRRSSPVIIKVVKTPEDKYKWMVLRLRGKFLPDGAKLRFGEKTGEPSSDLDLIEEFFRRLKERQKNE